MERFVALDLETTGIEPKNDEIIEVAAVRFVAGEPAGEFARLVCPEGVIPTRVKRLTGLDDLALAGAPALELVLPELLDFIGGDPLVAHNAAFDRSFLQAALRKRGYRGLDPWYDTLELSRLVLPLARSHRLEALATELRLQPPALRYHRAAGDARVAGLLFAALRRRLQALDPELVLALQALADPLAGTLRDVLAEAAAKCAARLPDRKIGLLLGRALQQPDGPENPAAEAEGGPERPFEFDADKLAALLGQDGPLARENPAFEERPGQLEMLRQVAQSLERGNLLLVEAGTGVGKSLAYLIPAVQWALATGQRVVVSTKTINLQEQLWEKDLPFLRRALDLPFTAAILKGRSNYLCLRKWEMERAEHAGWTPEERSFFMRLLAWAAATGTGDRTELNPIGPEEEWWSRVASEADACLGSKCRWHNNCFHFSARRRAEAAQLVVANHALVLTDAVAGRTLLPAHENVVLDEAHHLEDVATEYLGRSLTLAEIDRNLAGLRQRPGPGRSPGILARLRPLVGGMDREGEGGAILEALGERVQTAQALAGDLFSLLGKLGEEGAEDDESQATTVRLQPGREPGGSLWPAVRDARDGLVATLKGLAREIGKLRDQVASAPDALLLDLERSAAVAYDQAEVVGFVLDPQDDGEVRWFETQRRGRRSAAVLRSAPLAVGPRLRELLWDSYRAAVLTSATLATSGGFAHLRERLGLDDHPPGRVAEAVVKSPFDYRHQVLLCLPTDVPDPRRVPTAALAAHLEKILGELLNLTGGRALVLFTAHRLLREVYRRLKPALEREDISLLAQGIDGSRSRLLEDLRAAERTVVLGAASFWEGVDVPGPGLSCVVIVRLPFRSPGQPVVAARMEDLERRGLSAFERLTLPDAIIRFKQGFGRLVRSKTDRGVVVVLDPRLAAAAYGARFLRSLPGPAVAGGPMEELFPRLEHWLGQSY